MTNPATGAAAGKAAWQCPPQPAGSGAPCHLPKGNGNLCLRKNVYPDVCGSSVHSLSHVGASGSSRPRRARVPASEHCSTRRKWASRKPRGSLSAYYGVKEANGNRLPTLWFQVCNIPEKAKLQRQQKKISGCRGLREGDECMNRRQRTLGAVKLFCTLLLRWFTSPHICQSPQNVRHQARAEV